MIEGSLEGDDEFSTWVVLDQLVLQVLNQVLVREGQVSFQLSISSSLNSSEVLEGLCVSISHDSLGSGRSCGLIESNLSANIRDLNPHFLGDGVLVSLCSRLVNILSGDLGILDCFLVLVGEVDGE